MSDRLFLGLTTGRTTQLAKATNVSNPQENQQFFETNGKYLTKFDQILNKNMFDTRYANKYA